MTHKLSYPLQWPATGRQRIPEADREIARFSHDGSRISVAVATERLRDQVRLWAKDDGNEADADKLVLSTNIRAKKDGTPYSNARTPDDPGVVAYFSIGEVDYGLPSDKWTRVADNIAALAQYITGIRMQERTGVATTHEQMRFAALPSPETAGGTHWSQVLGVSSDASDAEVRTAYRRARSEAHTDRNACNTDRFHRVQEAWRLVCNERGMS